MMVTRGRRAFLFLLVIVFLFSAQPLEAAPGAEGTIIHVVGRGETLSVIAARYGTTVEAIVQANAIANPNLIYVGQRLTIPAQGSVAPEESYVVQPGDTLGGIAARFGTTVSALAQANDIADPSLIYPGQRLIIPSAVQQPPELPTQAQVHVVRPGEYLSQIARLYGTTVWALAVANDLANPSFIYPGQRLIIPTRSATLPAPISAVEFVPPQVAQGHTLLLKVRTEGEVSLAGNIDGRSLTFTGAAGEYWALAGFPPSSEPGAHPWSIVATDDEGRSGEASGYLLVTAADFPIQYIDLPPEREGLLDPALGQAEWARVKALFLQVTPSKLWQGRFLLPVEGEVSSLYGTRRSYEGGPVASYHMGVDYAAPEGTPVVAASSGRIALAEELTVRGKTVIIDHGLGVHTGYFHLSGIEVVPGQEVEGGTLIGYVGSTGLATGAHLHWEVRIGEIGVDPTEWTARAIPE